MSRYNEAMTAPAFDWDQELPPETEEEVYRALLRALRRKQGFGLVFVQCTVAQSAKIIADLHRDLPQQQMRELHLPAEVATLTDQIAQLWQQQPFDLLLVEGLQASLYGYEDTQRLSGWSSEDIYSYSWRGVPKILNHLNQQRDYLRNHFPARFVFFVPPFVVDYFLQRAADFIDWRSGLFCFPPDPQDIAQETERFLGQSYQHYLTLKPQERIEQILHLKDLLANCPDSERQPNLLFKLGLLYAAAQDYENAIISWDKALSIQPDNPAALTIKGVALSALGRYPEAIAAYDQALAIQPDNPAALTIKGIALSDLGRYPEAIAAYDQALAIQPDDHEALTNKGVALSHLGRKQEAIAAYDQALAIKPDYPDALYNKACCYGLQGHVELALASLHQAISLDAKYREMATTDSDFDAIRADPRFRL
jgi:tetratricopeptide (TPR) repeat protein